MKSVKLNYSYLFLVALVSFLWFIFKNHTAFEWPAIDMVPFYTRFFDPTFLANDFFTNASSNEPNPRWVFGYFVIGLSRLLGDDWYFAMYVLKVALVLAMPILFYLVIFYTLLKYLPKEQVEKYQILIAIAVAAIIYPRISGYFAIAWWRPFAIAAMPQSLSLCLGLLAIYLKDAKDSKIFSILLFFVATMIHPAIGLFCVSFYFILDIKNLPKNYKIYAWLFAIGFVLPSLIIKVFFDTTAPIDSAEFVRIYAIENHSSHYHVPHFGSLSSFSWKISFGVILLLMAVPLFYFLKKKARALALLGVLCILSYVGVVLIQYIFIDVFPSRLFASIGFSRFSQFGYWMVAILWISMLSFMLPKFKIFERFNFLNKGVLGVLLIALFITGIALKDNPRQEIYEADKDAYDFISTTPKDSVFAVYFDNLKVNLPIIAKRAVLAGNGFPFNEKYFYEYQDRNALLYGTLAERDKLKGSWDGEQVANFYRNLTPSDFVRISKKYKLDFVIIESDFSTNFAHIKPVFENEKLKIYSVKDF